jgi:hypothetical protein
MVLAIRRASSRDATPRRCSGGAHSDGKAAARRSCGGRPGLHQAPAPRRQLPAQILQATAMPSSDVGRLLGTLAMYPGVHTAKLSPPWGSLMNSRHWPTPGPVRVRASWPARGIPHLAAGQRPEPRPAGATDCRRLSVATAPLGGLAEKRLPIGGPADPIQRSWDWAAELEIVVHLIRVSILAHIKPAVMTADVVVPILYGHSGQGGEVVLKTGDRGLSLVTTMVIGTPVSLSVSVIVELMQHASIILAPRAIRNLFAARCTGHSRLA